MQAIEQNLAEMEGLVEALIWVNEHAEEEELPATRNFGTEVLYAISRILRETERAAAQLTKGMRREAQGTP